MKISRRNFSNILAFLDNFTNVEEEIYFFCIKQKINLLETMLYKIPLPYFVSNSCDRENKTILQGKEEILFLRDFCGLSKFPKKDVVKEDCFEKDLFLLCFDKKLNFKVGIKGRPMDKKYTYFVMPFTIDTKQIYKFFTEKEIVDKESLKELSKIQDKFYNLITGFIDYPFQMIELEENFDEKLYNEFKERFTWNN